MDVVFFNSSLSGYAPIISCTFFAFLYSQALETSAKYLPCIRGVTCWVVLVLLTEDWEGILYAICKLAQGLHVFLPSLACTPWSSGGRLNVCLCQLDEGSGAR